MWFEGAAVVLSVWLGSTVAPCGPVADHDAPHLAFRVHSGSDLRPPWLPGTQAIMESLFAEMGVRLRWIDCRHGAIEIDPACDRRPRANEIVLRVQRTKPDRASHACGASLRPDAEPGHFITLFLDCIRAGSDALKVAEPVLAAYTLAHEVGHLLLPSVGHAPSGLMRARPDRFDWERAKRGALRFRPAERQQMQQALRQRIGSPM